MGEWPPRRGRPLLRSPPPHCRLTPVPRHRRPTTHLCQRLTETYEAHSGYNFKGTLLDRVGLLNSDHARHHDFHHSANSGAYGSVFMDYVGGTLDAYREHIEKCKSK